eukprot:TRINITY_DN12598_c0_g2_i1.p1 TRINITY_DN12598_c0_g2~~TRINITY_DN12598_c0_g2_i1.p1  ORF type:complete len:436 (+),score=66.28 TRINITY_DN12598_c0_g2_i1:42-1349(+)
MDIGVGALLPPGMPLFNPAHNTHDYNMLNEALEEGGYEENPVFSDGDVFWEMLGYQAHFDSRARRGPLVEVPVPGCKKVVPVNESWLPAFIEAWKRKFPVTLQIVDVLTNEVLIRFRVLSEFVEFCNNNMRNDFSGDLLLRKEETEGASSTPSIKTRFSYNTWLRVTQRWDTTAKCTADDTNTELNELRRLINTTECTKESVELLIKRDEADESLGLIFSASSLLLDEVTPSSPAARCGAGKLVGRQLVSVNGQPVATEADAILASAGKIEALLEFRSTVAYDEGGLVEQCSGCKTLEGRIEAMENKVKEVFCVEPNVDTLGTERQMCRSCSLDGIMPWAEICPSCRHPLRESSPEPVSSWPVTTCLGCSTPLRLPSTAQGYTTTISCPRCRVTSTCVLPPSPSPRRKPSNRQLTCENCLTPLHGAFCHACGHRS